MNPAEIAIVEQTQADAQSRKLQIIYLICGVLRIGTFTVILMALGCPYYPLALMPIKPKARACAKWSDSVWAEYYVRKAKLEKGEAVSMDFSNIGAMPHDILNCVGNSRHVVAMIVNVPNCGSVGVVQDLSAHELPINAWTDASNIRFLDGYVHQAYGYNEVYDSASVIPYHVLPVNIGTARYWIYASLAKIFTAQQYRWRRCSYQSDTANGG